MAERAGTLDAQTERPAAVRGRSNHRFSIDEGLKDEAVAQALPCIARQTRSGVAGISM